MLARSDPLATNVPRLSLSQQLQALGVHLLVGTRVGWSVLIGRTLGRPAAEAKALDASAASLDSGINAVYANATSGVYLDTKQTHLVLPLAAGAVPAALRPTTFSELEHTIVVRNSGHLDTGLTGTYFLTKLLVEAARNDLLYTMNTKTDFPGYGNFVARGFTTWPEDWVAKPGAHGKRV